MNRTSRLSLAALLILFVPARAPVAAAGRNPRADGAAEVEESIRASIQEFKLKHRGARAEEALDGLLAAIGAAVPEFGAGGPAEDPWLRSLRALAAAGTAEGSGEAGARRKAERVKGEAVRAGGAAAEPSFAAPAEIAYQFGTRRLVALEPEGAANKALLRALKAGALPQPTDVSTPRRLALLLHGVPPEQEIALALLEKRLDVHEGADRFAEFLEAWRNHGPHGDESFYEALDRTAGTPEEVFFFDAMLGAFVGQFAAEEGRRWSLPERHKRLQRAFLSYRQYRGMIEATAFALTLPVDVPFPERLARYDYGAVGAGSLSFRHQIDVLAELHDGDVAAVATWVERLLAAQPLPAELWQPYDPLAAFSAEFLALMQTKVQEVGLSTDELFEQRGKRMRGLAERIREAARESLSVSG